MKRAFVRSLEIIGEAVKNLPDDLKIRYPDLDWRRMAGTRDRLIHGYFSVDFELVWDIIQNKIPPLDAGIRQIISQET
ncbi:HepT-like ribonuclease domain-containing protein [Geoalkalibacter halelectricus]|uniref:HepT-like ribonuclease domain-containing protein n=1 Tax=Geoalkalibacter halelectricus TaxID=2847045 RepID=UPI00346076E1